MSELVNYSDLTSRLGVLDIGSNSVRLVIYELFGAHFTPVYNEKVLAGLGRDLNRTGNLSETGKVATLAALKRFKILTDSLHLDTVLIGATAALRVAADAPDFIKTIKQETGFEIEPISGLEEARLTAMGLISSQPVAKGLAADLGGASLELIKVEGGKTGPGISLPLGPFEVIGRDLSGFSDFSSVELQARVKAELSKANLEAHHGQALYLIGGAWRNLASVHQNQSGYPLKVVQSYALSQNDAAELSHWAYSEGREALLSYPGIKARRAETLPYSGFLLSELIKQINPSDVVISQTGLREGIVYDHLSDTLKSRDALLDGCQDLAHGNLQAIHFGDPLFEFLEEASQEFKSCFDPANETRLRKAACYLAGFGKGLHPDYTPALVFDDILYAPFSALNHKERVYLSLMLYSSYTRKDLTGRRADIIALLSEEERKAAKIYGMAMRVGIVASGRSIDLLDQMRLILKDNEVSLDIPEDLSALYTPRVKYRMKKLSQIGDFALG